MKIVYKTSTQIYGDQCKAEGCAEGYAESYAESYAQAKLDIAKNLLDILDNGMISLKTGLPLDQIEQLRANS